MLGTDCLSGVCTNAGAKRLPVWTPYATATRPGSIAAGRARGATPAAAATPEPTASAGSASTGMPQPPATISVTATRPTWTAAARGGCDDGLLCAVDADCSGGRCENNRCASGPNYARFGRWTTVPDGNLGGANVPLQWPDGIARSGITARGAALTAVCARPSDVWGANNPVRGQVYRMRGGGPGYGLRYDGPCAGDPAPRRIQNLGRGCRGNAYLRVMHTASYPLPHNARFTHNGLCYRDLGVLGGELRHPPAARGHRRPQPVYDALAVPRRCSPRYGQRIRLSPCGVVPTRTPPPAR